MPEETGTSMFDSYQTPSMALRELRDYTNFLSGKIKTIIDAAIEDPQRRKAIKDLVHNAIWEDTYTKAMHWSQGQNPLEKTASIFPFSHSGNPTPSDYEQQ